MPDDRTIAELRVTLTTIPNAGSAATVWVRLRQGGMHPAARLDWPAGAPTPSGLLELEGAVLQELQTLILTHFGVQGALLPEGVPDGR